jgi:hypothetical protein
MPGLADDEASARRLEKVSSLHPEPCLTVLSYGVCIKTTLSSRRMTPGFGDLSILLGDVMIWLCVGFLIA